MATRAELIGQARVVEDMLRCVTAKSMYTEVVRANLHREIVAAIVGAARAGIGPQDQPYKPYSESYKKALGMTEEGGRFKRYSAKKGLLVQYKGKNRKAKVSAGTKLWLVGLATLSRGPGEHMLPTAADGLATGRYTMDIPAQGPAMLTWNAADDAMAVRAAVHQGTTYGGQDHTKGKVPARPWWHIDSTRAINAAIKAFKQAAENLCAAFNAGRKVA